MGSSISKYLVLFILITLSLSGCEDDQKIGPTNEQVAPKPQLVLKSIPDFSADSAYSYIKKQVDFGPRVPNTDNHVACAKWLEGKLDSYGLKTNVQEASVVAYNGLNLEIFNIMGQYLPENEKRILLCAHWDTRPYADRDSKDLRKPIDGANDGASGVGVLLEIARVLGSTELPPNVGVDIVFFDAEDYGKPEGSMVGNSSNSWCLGSQYWSKNLPIPGYKAEYGILLDMVGAGNAVFPKEGISMYYAPQVVNHVWNIAAAMGHTNYFKPFKGNEITDDHRYLNEIARIPTIDIIHYEMGRNDFGVFHHTHDDNMDVIAKPTLKVVGEVVLQVIYSE